MKGGVSTIMNSLKIAKMTRQENYDLCLEAAYSA